MDRFGISFQNTAAWSVDYLSTLLFTSIPGWVRGLLTMRDAIVKPFGLSTGEPPMPEKIAPTIRSSIGEKAVYFTVIERTESEIVMAEDDKHLYFRVSVIIDRNNTTGDDTLYLTTIVHFHNIWGRIYFTPVKPFHQLIIRSLLKRLHKNLHA